MWYLDLSINLSPFFEAVLQKVPRLDRGLSVMSVCVLKLHLVCLGLPCACWMLLLVGLPSHSCSPDWWEKGSRTRNYLLWSFGARESPDIYMSHPGFGLGVIPHNVISILPLPLMLLGMLLTGPTSLNPAHLYTDDNLIPDRWYFPPMSC